jgi:branched-chain amino acid transport system substrate-binding protein
VHFIMGTFASNIGLAVADFAKQRKVLFIAAEPLTDKIVWQNGNRYTFRLRTSTYMQTAMLVPEAAKLKKKRWAIVYPNYEYGQSATRWFKELLKKAQPDVEFVVEQAPALGKIDAGAVAQAIADAKPDAIFSSLFGPDLAKFVREGNTRGLFKDRPVFNLLAGEPEYLDPLKDETPEGWYVTGYPWNAINTPEHQKFLAAYQKRWNDYPRLGSVVGYATMMTAVEAMRKAGSVDTEKLIAAMKGLEVMTPFGKAQFRALDHQSTMGAYVGRIGQKDGKGVMTSFQYMDGAKFLPSDAEVRKMRPAD